MANPNRKQGRAIRGPRDQRTEASIAASMAACDAALDADVTIRTGLTQPERTRLNRLAWALVARYDAYNDGVRISLHDAMAYVFDEWLSAPEGIDSIKPAISGYWAD